MPPLCSAQSLRALLAHPPADLVLIDARSGADAGERYAAGHLPGARHVDLDHDLAAHTDDPAQGGRHPLPTPAAFAAVLGRLGIGTNSRVVVYDDKGGANAAARFWWMLRSAGHAGVQVLDGGWPAALAAGIASTAEVPPPANAPPYPFAAWQGARASIDEVRRASRDGSSLIVDVREPVRYRGESEPIDATAGHIPGAVNLPYADSLDPDGAMRAAGELASRYEAALGERAASEVIVHCGSGVTACHTLLAFEHAGLPMPRLYVGSWSEWSRTGDPVATGAR